MNNPSLDCTICTIEGGDNGMSPHIPNLPQVDCNDTCNGMEQFRGGRGGGRRGGRGGRRGGGYRRGYRNWGGGYQGFGYYPYWYGSHYYSPTYYDYPYVSQPPVLTGVVPSSSYNSQIPIILAVIALIVAFFALRR